MVLVGNLLVQRVGAGGLRQLEEEGGIEDEDLRNVRQQGAHDFGALGLRAVVQRGEHSQILDLVDGLVGHEGRLREDGATLHHTVADGDNASLRQVRAVLLEEAEHALQTLLVVVNRLFKLVLFAVVLVLVVAVGSPIFSTRPEARPSPDSRSTSWYLIELEPELMTRTVFAIVGILHCD